MTATDDERRRASLWAATADTGVSSKAIMTMMMGAPIKDWWCYPHDSSDFGRCIGLLEAVPEWRARMGEMAKVGPEWAALVERWAELEALYAAKHHKELSNLMRSILRPLEDKRPGLVRFGNMTIYMGGGIFK